MADTQTEIQAKVKRVLQGTPFSPESLKQLSGGTANFIYHAILEKPLPEYPNGVVVKQGEAYVATNPNFPLATSRCVRLLLTVQCIPHFVELIFLPRPLSSSV